MTSASTKSVLPPETRILVISNTKARGITKSGSMIKLSQLPKNSFHYMSQSKSDLPPIIREAVQLDIEHILIEGGDGTVRIVMTILLNNYTENQTIPAISIIPSGTTNQIARNLGLKKAKEIEAIFQGNFKETILPLVKIQKQHKSKEDTHPLYGFLFSTGALPYISRFAQEKYNENGIGGGTAVIGGVVKAITGDKSQLMPPETHKMSAFRSNMPVFEHDDIAMGVVMTTLPSLMLGLDPFWGHENAPLRVTWSKANSRKIGRTLTGLWLGRKKDRSDDGFYSHNIDRLNLHTNALAALDGDFLDISGETLSISASRPVRFWQSK
jgi:hypothetical protein